MFPLYFIIGLVYTILIIYYFLLPIPVEIPKRYRKIVIISDSKYNRQLRIVSKRKIREYYPNNKKLKIHTGSFKNCASNIPNADLVIVFELNALEKWWYNKYPNAIDIKHSNVIRVRSPFFVEFNPYMVKDRKILLD